MVQVNTFYNTGGNALGAVTNTLISDHSSLRSTPRNNFDKKVEHGLSIGFQLGGSNTRMMAADAEEKISLVDGDRNILKLVNPTVSDDINTLVDIIDQVADISVGTVRIVASIAGFPTKTGIQPGGIQPKQEDGLLYLANRDFGHTSEEYSKAPKHKGAQEKNTNPYLNLMNIVKRILPVEAKFTYIDEANPTGIVYDATEKQGTHIILEVMNDTVAAGESAAALKAKEGDNTKGIVVGTGFNDSSNKDFSEKTASSRTTQNNESGQMIVPQDLLLEFDKSHSSDGTKEAQMRAEIFFAGGSEKDGAELNGIRRMIANTMEFIHKDDDHNQAYAKVAQILNQELKQNLPDLGFELDEYDVQTFDDSIGNHPDDNRLKIPSNIEVVKRASKGEKVYKALTLLKFNQLGNYLVQRDLNDSNAGEDYLKNLQVIGVTGSSIVGNFQAIPEVKAAFLKPFQVYNPNVQIHEHELGGLDGMEDIINAKAALARAGA